MQRMERVVRGLGIVSILVVAGIYRDDAQAMGTAVLATLVGIIGALLAIRGRQVRVLRAELAACQRLAVEAIRTGSCD